MAARWFVPSLIIALLCGQTPACAEGLLGGIRGEVNEESSSDSGRSSSDGGSHFSFGNDDDDNDGLAELGFWVTLAVVTSPFTLPIAIIGDSYGQDAGFPDAPYDSSTKGYLQISDETATGRDWAARLSFETGGNFDDLSTIGGRLQLETDNRLGIDAAWSSFNEQIGGGRDRLTLGDANLVFRFAQAESIQFTTGVGFNWMADADDFDAGFNLTYGFDWFPVKPIVVSSTMDLGALGGATLFRSRTTIGAMIDRFEVYSGFDYLNIEGVDVPMGIGGLRIWY